MQPREALLLHLVMLHELVGAHVIDALLLLDILAHLLKSLCDSAVHLDKSKTSTRVNIFLFCGLKR